MCVSDRNIVQTLRTSRPTEQARTEHRAKAEHALCIARACDNFRTALEWATQEDLLRSTT